MSENLILVSVNNLIEWNERKSWTNESNFEFEKDLISFDSVMKYKFKSKEEFFCFSKIAPIVV